jgi:hypothetical protein
MQRVTPSELKELLLNVAPYRPVFIWGPPGIGKTAIINAFGAEIGMPVISLLGSQLAPEDLIGVPRIVEEAGVNYSVFAPPRMIAGHAGAVILFCDEFNASSPEVQKAFYSLITEQRLGEMRLPKGSIVILAGNRAQDNAITRTVSSALMNRVLHVELHPDKRDWLLWAYGAGIHPWVLKYIETRHDHLFSAPPKTEEPFSSPRSWHILSDALKSYGDDKLTPAVVRVLAEGSVTRSHAHNFAAFVRLLAEGVAINDIIAGSAPLPLDPGSRDMLTFVVQAMRAQLTKELPPTKAELAPEMKQRIHVVRGIVAELARADEELVVLLFAREDGDDARNYPAWFLADMSATLGRLAKVIVPAPAK